MKLRIAVVVALLVGVAGLSTTGSTASAGTAPVASRVTPTPTEGHYSGRDGHGNHIRFNYSGSRIHHFRINHLDIGGAHVSQARWSTSCTDAYYCSWGEWTSTHDVRGAWNQGTHGGTARHFTAHWVSADAG